MIVSRENGTFVEFEMQRVSQNCLQRVSIPLDLYLRLVEESRDLATLRLKVIETAHELNEIAHREQCAALGRAKAKAATDSL